MNDAETKKPRGLLFYALFFACLGIWGYVLYQVAHGLSAAQDPFDDVSPASVAKTPLAPATRRPGPSTTYNRDFRDPFARPSALFTPIVTRVRRSAPPAAPEPPPLVLNGVVDKTALLRGEDGSVYVARVGEHAGGARLLKVERDHVVVRYGGRSHTLKLTQ